MSIFLSGIFFLSVFLSLLICNAGEIEALPKDNESPIVSGVQGVRKLKETRRSQSAPCDLTSSSETLSHKIDLPIFDEPLKKGDTIMVLEDTDTARKLLVKKLQLLGFNVIDSVYGHQAYDLARKAAEEAIEIPLFLFDFDLPFKKDEVAVIKSCGQPELNGGQTAGLIKQIRFGDKKPFEKSVFVCLTSTPEHAQGYKDVFWQVRGKLTEPNTDQFFEGVRRQLTISELASAIVPAVIQHGTNRALGHLLKKDKDS